MVELLVLHHAMGRDLAELLEEAEEDLPRLYASLRRTVRERKTLRRGIFPNDAAALRLAGHLLIEQYDEWPVAHRYLSVEEPK